MSFLPQAPNEFQLVLELNSRYPTMIKTDPFLFTRFVAWELSKRNPNWGLNGKRGDPNNLSTDVVAFKNPTGPGGVELIDIILGASDPQVREPNWSDVTRQTIEGDTVGIWVRASDPGVEPPSTPPTSGGGPLPVFPHIPDVEFTALSERLETIYASLLARPPRDTHVDPLGRARWTTDYLTARARKYSHERALDAMENEIRKIVGLPLLEGETFGAITIDGRQFRYASGQPFPWIMASGFALNGISEERQRTFCRWAKDSGLLGIRFDYVNAFVFDGQGLPRVDRWKAKMNLPRTLEILGEFGLYGELTLLTDTREPFGFSSVEMEAIVQEGSEIAGRYENVIIELANENSHPSQSGLLQDKNWLRRMLSFAPGMASPGSTHGGEDFYLADLGDWINIHGDRGVPLDDFRRLEALSIQLNKPGVDDEPIGVGPVDIPGKRTTDVGLIQAISEEAKGRGLHATLHGEFGLWCNLPSATEQRAVDAYVQIWR